MSDRLGPDKAPKGASPLANQSSDSEIVRAILEMQETMLVMARMQDRLTKAMIELTDLMGVLNKLLKQEESTGSSWGNIAQEGTDSGAQIP